MSEFKYSHLFEPIVLGNQLFRNRIFNSPTGVEIDPERYSCAYYERKAIGGSASVCIGDACPNEFGRVRPSRANLGTHHESHTLANRPHRISRHGAAASMEFLDAGNCATYSASLGAPLYGPVDGISPEGIPIHMMTEEQIYASIEQHAKSALYAKRLGYGMVTVHGGHGWLITQFLDPTNNRNDQWGGSIENRARLAIAICDRIHEVCGRGFPVEIRIVGDEVYPGGYHIEEGIKQAQLLDGHADLIHVSTGSHEVKEVFTITHPSMFLADGANVKYAAEIKKYVKNTPIATVGALSEPDQLEEIIASGQADVVELARGLICDPDLPIKLQRGKEDEVRKCMRCLFCFSEHMHSAIIPCAINPEMGHEYEMHDAPICNVKKKVLIAGGGMAGMQAAITAADNNHEVILCEKKSELGGALLCEENVPFKEKLGQYIALQKRFISRRNNIEVHLNTEVTPELIKEVSPDAVICALGARPVKPNIPGIDRDNVFSAEEIYYDPDKAGENIVILGGGLVGLELSIMLSGLGKECTVVEMMPNLNDGGNNLHGVALSCELKKCGVKVSPATKAVAINEDGVLCEYTGAKPAPESKFGMDNFYPDGTEGNVTFAADTVIYAVGQKPLREEANALRGIVPEFHQVGDCVVAKNIYEATHNAHYIAKDLGRM
ncbi:MAG: FAD-dependent oxidoreductase [Lachnospiraceae bacterium]|nr:FAD-dependent oxidoreductase [Lachnospiraceae bacterium]